MSQKRAEVMTQWNASDGFKPQIVVDYPITTYLFEDITGQDTDNLVPEINLYNIQLTAESTVIDLIELDNNYYVLWVEDI